MIRFLLGLVAILVVFGVASAVYLALGDTSSLLRALASQWDDPVSTDSTAQAFRVSEGQSADEIGQALEQQGLIRSALLFSILVRVRGVEGKLTRGEHELRPNMTSSQVLDALVAGSAVRRRTFAVLEGWRAAEIAQHLEAFGYAKGEDFLATVSAPWRIGPFHELVGQVPSLEGYLFPDTYELERGMTAEVIVERMVRQFDTRAGNDLRRKAQANGLTLHQAVTLASIIEREAGLGEERRLISGVFHNRLRAGMPLAADPTVQYAVANQDLRRAASLGFWKEALTPEDLAIASPFNTYQTTGLPPGPICNPGLASLWAAVDPEPTDYYYFVAAGNGGHKFARTAQEHQANIRRLAAGESPGPPEESTGPGR